MNCYSDVSYWSSEVSYDSPKSDNFEVVPDDPDVPEVRLSLTMIPQVMVLLLELCDLATFINCDCSYSFTESESLSESYPSALSYISILIFGYDWTS